MGVDYIAFDIETTGLQPGINAVVEIAAVRFDHNGKTLDTFEALVDPGREIPPDAQAIHGISDEMVAGCPRIAEVMPEFLRFLGPASNVLFAHNAPFDLGFLAFDLARLRMPCPQHAVLDSIDVCRMILRLRSYSLPAVCQALRVVPLEAHRALGDADAVRALLTELARRRPHAAALTRLAELCPRYAFEEFRPRAPALPPGMETLERAIEAQCDVLIEYTGGSRGPAPRLVQPRFVYATRTTLYLIALCRSDGIEKTFRVDRIRAVRVV